MVEKKTKIKAKVNKVKRQVSGRCTLFCGDTRCKSGCIRARGFGR